MNELKRAKNGNPARNLKLTQYKIYDEIFSVILKFKLDNLIFSSIISASKFSLTRVFRKNLKPYIISNFSSLDKLKFQNNKKLFSTFFQK